jgi:hypothetical protein
MAQQQPQDDLNAALADFAAFDASRGAGVPNGGASAADLLNALAYRSSGPTPAVPGINKTLVIVGLTFAVLLLAGRRR